MITASSCNPVLALVMILMKMMIAMKVMKVMKVKKVMKVMKVMAYTQNSYSYRAISKSSVAISDVIMIIILEIIRWDWINYWILVLPQLQR